MIFAPNVEEIDRHIADLKLLLTSESPIILRRSNLQRIITNMELMRDELEMFRWQVEQQRRKALVA